MDKFSGELFYHSCPADFGLTNSKEECMKNGSNCLDYWNKALKALEQKVRGRFPATLICICYNRYREKANVKRR